MDIIYTAGDNADYTPILKPYHGIYIFIQKEEIKFEQEYFLPMHGAYKAIPFDFDQDGDIDIASISFFPDYSKSQRNDFILFENRNDQLIPQSLPLNNKGRWISLDHGDIDQDGDMDLILGSLTFAAPGHPKLVNNWVKEGLPFIILENLNK